MDFLTSGATTDNLTSPIEIALIAAGAALIGALIPTVSQLFQLMMTNRREAQSLSTAIRAEISALMDDPETNDDRQDYEKLLISWEAGDFSKIRAQLTPPGEDPMTLVYRINLANIGLLDPNVAGQIVQFYQHYTTMSYNKDVLASPDYRGAAEGILVTNESRLGVLRKLLNDWDEKERIGQELLSIL